MSNFSFSHYVFKKLSAAEASESVYMRERVRLFTLFVETSGFFFFLGVSSVSGWSRKAKIEEQDSKYFKFQTVIGMIIMQTKFLEKDFLNSED